ncbi:MAG TPA: hypothetical protein VMT28_02825 [Terriglobales bacterium]|jgi:hypothetical protein|nr:hypothetical protein [Terriglobales bacterium]
MHRKDRWILKIILSLTVAVALGALPVQAKRAPEIPAGTTVKVRVIDKLSSEENEVGDNFHGTLEEPIMVDGKELYPKGADVNGRVTDVHRSGRLSEPGELDLVLTTVTSGSLSSSLAVEPLVIKGESHAKSNATKIGGGAALGAIIGAIAGGGKGAAVGAGVGGAAGTGAAAATGKKPATVESEAVLAFTTTAPSGAAGETATPQAAVSTPGRASATGVDKAPDQGNQPAATVESNDSSAAFTLRDRRVIRDCVSEHASDFPPETTVRPELPSGEERQLQKGQTMPADIAKQVKSLPLACEQQLPALPADQERVVYNGRVLLINSKNYILDQFYLDGTD